MMKRLTIVAYAINGSGLGHLTRIVAILRWIRRLAWLAGIHPQIYILTSSEACGLATREGFASFKIPSKTVARQGDLDKDDYLRLARQWVWHSLGLLKPDLLIVDTFPGGTFGELMPALESAKTRVLIHRSLKPEFAAQPEIQGLLNWYDSIIVPDEPGTAPQSLPVHLQERILRVGPILLRDRDDLLPREVARNQLGIPDSKLAVWLSAGGGGDPGVAVSLCRLVDALGADPDLHLVIGAGPLYQGSPLRGPHITWITDVLAVEHYLGLDCAISAAGFNSFYELLHVGIPTAFYGQDKIADDQHLRVATALQMGCALALGPDLALLDSVLQALKDPDTRRQLSQSAQAFVPQNWAREVAAAILALLVPRAVVEEVLELGSVSFFHTLSAVGLTLDQIEPALALLPETLEGTERRELFLMLLNQTQAFDAGVVLRLWQAWGRRWPSVKTWEEAEALVESACAILPALLAFGDEQGALAFIRLLPLERTRPPWSELHTFLHCLQGQGETLWRGMAILSRHRGQLGQEQLLLPALIAATQELGLPQVPVAAGHPLTSLGVVSAPFIVR